MRAILLKGPAGRLTRLTPKSIASVARICIYIVLRAPDPGDIGKDSLFFLRARGWTDKGVGNRLEA